MIVDYYQLAGFGVQPNINVLVDQIYDSCVQVC